MTNSPRDFTPGTRVMNKASSQIAEVRSVDLVAGKIHVQYRDGGGKTRSRAWRTENVTTDLPATENQPTAASGVTGGI